MIDGDDLSDLEPQTKALVYALSKLFGPDSDPRQIRDAAKQNIIKLVPMDPEIWSKLSE